MGGVAELAPYTAACDRHAGSTRLMHGARCQYWSPAIRAGIPTRMAHSRKYAGVWTTRDANHADERRIRLRYALAVFRANGNGQALISISVL